MFDGCSTAKERDDAAKAMTMIKRLTILTMLRRTELNRTGSILPVAFCNCLRRCRDEGTFRGTSVDPSISDVKGGGPLGSDVPLAVLVRDTKVLDCVIL